MCINRDYPTVAQFLMYMKEARLGYFFPFNYCFCINSSLVQRHASLQLTMRLRCSYHVADGLAKGPACFDSELCCFIYTLRTFGGFPGRRKSSSKETLGLGEIILSSISLPVFSHVIPHKRISETFVQRSFSCKNKS